MKLLSIAALAGALALGATSAAHADFPTFFGAEADFTAAGSVLQITNFDAYDSNITVLDPTLTVGALTFSADPLIVIGSDSYLQPVRNLITNNQVAGDTDVSVDLGGYNMLAFKMGNLVSFGEQVFLTLNTNLDTYYYGLYPQPAPEALSFYGFVVPIGEYFTGLTLNHTEANQVFGITDVTLGVAGQVCDTRNCYPGGGGGVPEPASWALMIAGFGLVGSTLRARRRSTTGTPAA